MFEKSKGLIVVEKVLIGRFNFDCYSFSVVSSKILVYYEFNFKISTISLI